MKPAEFGLLTNRLTNFEETFNFRRTKLYGYVVSVRTAVGTCAKKCSYGNTS